MKKEYCSIAYQIKCPSCGKKIRYRSLSGMGSDDIYWFYSHDGKKLLMSENISAEIDKLLKSNVGDNAAQAQAIDQLLAAKGFESFAIWNNVRCFSCGFLFPYSFKGNVNLRLGDPAVILIEGIQMIRDKTEPYIICFK